MLKNIDMDFLFKLKFPRSLKASPSRTKLAYTVSSASLEDNKYLTDLYLWEGPEAKRLTYDGKAGSFIWEDERTLLFSADRDSEEEKKKKEGLAGTTYYRLRTDGGEAEKAFEIPLSVSRIERLSDQYYLLSASFNALNPELYLASEEERKKAAKEEKDFAFRKVLREIPFWSNGPGFVHERREGLFLYHAGTKRICRLTPVGQTVHDFILSEDKKRLYYISSASKPKPSVWTAACMLELPEAAEMPSEGNLCDRVVELYPELDLEISMLWETEPEKGAESPIYMLASDMREYGINQSSTLYELERNTHRPVRLSEQEIIPYDCVNTDISLGSSPGIGIVNGAMYYLTTERYQTAIHRITREGKIEQLYTAPGAILSLQVLQSGIACFALMGRKASELYLLRKNEEGTVSQTQLGSLNDKLLAGYNISTVHPVDKGENDIDGWVLLPHDFDPSRQYPAILDIHGGPRTAYGEVFFHEMEYWTAKDYIVFFCNPRGSGGRGDAFADIRGKYGTVDYDDIMEFCDRVFEAYPQIDKQRVGVTGGSYGGFMCNWIIGHTERFAACATQRSIMNWTSFYGVSDIGFYFATDQNGCDTFSQAGFAKLWEHSPLKYINSAKTPTLIIHSEEDYRCPVEQGYQLLTALLDREVDCEMVLFHGETHELSRSGKPKGRRERLERITNWMGRYLKAE